MRSVYAELAATRPTAVNLFWALERMQDGRARSGDAARGGARDPARGHRRLPRDRRARRAAAPRRRQSSRTATPARSPPAATAPRSASSARPSRRAASIRVFADETRPLLQGARLTAWELQHDGIHVTLICDNMAAHLMAQRRDPRGHRRRRPHRRQRRRRQQDRHLRGRARGGGPWLPFFVAAPWSTVDLATFDGSAIPIEERGAEEVSHHGGQRLCSCRRAGAQPGVRRDAGRYVSAIITERGVARAPFGPALDALRSR